MAKREPIKITTKAFVHVGDQLVDVDTLNQQQRVELATQLKLTYLNTLFQGQATFTRVE